MKDMMKKVVILDNLALPYVHQAIIVMRDYDPKLESRAVIEAERIVSAYLDNTRLNTNTRCYSRHGAQKKKKKYALYTVCALAAAAAVLAIIFL